MRNCRFDTGPYKAAIALKIPPRRCSGRIRRRLDACGCWIASGGSKSDPRDLILFDLRIGDSVTDCVIGDDVILKGEGSIIKTFHDIWLI